MAGCAQCGGCVVTGPFYYQPDRNLPGTWYDAPVYFFKPNSSKADFAGPDQRVDFCSAECACKWNSRQKRACHADCN